MTKTTRLIGLGLLIMGLVVIARVSGFGAGATNEPGQLKIAVVNMVEVFDKYKKLEQYQAQLTAEDKTEEARQKELFDTIEELRKEMKALDPQSERWDLLNEQANLTALKRENRSKTYMRQRNKRVNTQMAELYQDVRNAIERYAAEKVISIVLKVDPAKIITEGNKTEDAQLAIATRPVLYYEKTIDITQDIINILNK